MIAVACLCLAAAPAAGQVGNPSEDQVKAAYLYNFGRYIKWPPAAAADQERSFTICVFNEDPFGATLDAELSRQMLNGKPVAIKRIAKPQDAAGCRIAFIHLAQSDRLPDILASLNQNSVLTVSDMPDFLRRGGMIQFVLHDERVRFEINLTTAASARLTVSSELLKVASSVIGKAQGRE
jgi:hypothetical protein